jgi:hypothetical protein
MERDGDHHIRRWAGVIGQAGAAPVFVIDQPDSGLVSSIVTCSWCDCRNATAVVPQVMAITAVTIRTAKTNVAIGDSLLRQLCRARWQTEIACGWDAVLWITSHHDEALWSDTARDLATMLERESLAPVGQ